MKRVRRSSESGPVRTRPIRDWHVTRALPLIALWAVPALAAVIAAQLSASSDAASVEAPAASSIVVGSREVDGATAVNAIVMFGEEPKLRTHASGVVTAVNSPGSIENGAALFAIDDVPVLAYRGPVLFRDLVRGDRGSDVAALAGYLSALGLIDAGSGGEQFGPALQAGVRELQRRIGVEADGVFRLRYISYVPDDATMIARAEVRLGDRVSEDSTVLVATAPALSVDFKPVAEGSALAPFKEDLPIVLRLSEREVELTSTELTGEEAAAVAGELALGASVGVDGVDDENRQIVYSGAVLAFRDPKTSGVVPSTAVQVNAAGQMCVFVVTGKSAEDTAVDKYDAQVLKDVAPGSEMGTVVVDVTLVGQRVVRDVSLVERAAERCG